MATIMSLFDYSILNSNWLLVFYINRYSGLVNKKLYPIRLFIVTKLSQESVFINIKFDYFTVIKLKKKKKLGHLNHKGCTCIKLNLLKAKLNYFRNIMYLKSVHLLLGIFDRKFNKYNYNNNRNTYLLK